MHNNGTHVGFPSLGSGGKAIRIYGSDPKRIKKTIKDMLEIACLFYSGSFVVPQSLIKPGTELVQTTKGAPFDPQGMLAPFTKDELLHILSHITQKTGCEFLVRPQSPGTSGGLRVELFGDADTFKEALRELCAIEALHINLRDLILHVELGAEHEEFISGKKNGKMNKITKMTGVQIDFGTSVTPGLMSIQLHGVYVEPTLEGLLLLEVSYCCVGCVGFVSLTLFLMQRTKCLQKSVSTFQRRTTNASSAWGESPSNAS
jgi:hypothetical protein